MLKRSLASLAIAATVVAGGAIQDDASAAELAKRQYRACPTEDSSYCIWHNEGPGFSFVSGPPEQGVWRVSDRLANKLQARHGEWRRPGRWLGVRFDDTHGGSFVVKRGDVVSVGGTTYVIRPSGRVGTS